MWDCELGSQITAHLLVTIDCYSNADYLCMFFVLMTSTATTRSMRSRRLPASVFDPFQDYSRGILYLYNFVVLSGRLVWAKLF